jgi:hypothetical protein
MNFLDNINTIYAHKKRPHHKQIGQPWIQRNILFVAHSADTFCPLKNDKHTSTAPASNTAGPVRQAQQSLRQQSTAYAIYGKNRKSIRFSFLYQPYSFSELKLLPYFTIPL